MENETFGLNETPKFKSITCDGVFLGTHHDCELWFRPCRNIGVMRKDYTYPDYYTARDKPRERTSCIVAEGEYRARARGLMQ